MRPGFFMTVAPNQRAHVELFNPANSGYIADQIEIRVSKTTGFCVLGKGAPMLDNATFPDSRGLTVMDGAIRQHSSCHVRTKLVTLDPGVEVIQGGQYHMHEGPAPTMPIVFPGELGPGTGLMVRNNYDGQPLVVSFSWREVPV